MVLLKIALAAFVAGQAAYAQDCSTSATATIQNAGDASAFASCPTYTGSIAVATDTTDPISIAGVRQLLGNLVLSDVPNITDLGAPSLQSIQGEFQLSNVQKLASLSFPRLAEVGSIVWKAMPQVATLSFNAGVQKASTVDIQNTGLNSLDGINLQIVELFRIANNPQLNKIEAQLGNVSEGMILQGNGESLTVNFPNLVWAKNISFHNCSEISVPSLKFTNGSLNFYSNKFEVFSAPNLTNVGGTLAFVSNNALNNISLPLLESIKEAFQLANNTNLKKVDGVPKLKTVNGALDFFGNFTQVDLPALELVAGAFNLQSSEDVKPSCDHFDTIHGPSKTIRGKYFCKGQLSNPGGEGTTPTGSKPTKTNAAATLGFSKTNYMGVTGVLAAMLGML